MDGNLKDVLMPMAILGTIGFSTYLFTKTMTEYILRKKMIEKGFVNDDTQAIFRQHVADNKMSSLKWGLIMFFVGLALIIMEYIPTSPESPLPYGLIAMSVSAGFLVYYFLVRKDVK